MSVRRRQDHSLRNFFKRTISAQLHAFGCLLVGIGGIVLLPMSRKMGSEHFLACASFLITGFLVFFASAFYHFLDDGFEVSPPLRRLLNNLDHFSIYLFIAGTYTPCILAAVSPSWRFTLLCLIWTIAALGITYTYLKPRLPPLLQNRIFYTSIFVLMGWTIIIRIGDVVSTLTAYQWFFLLAGSLAYTIGAVVYATKRPVLFEGIFGFHEVWHITVLMGAFFHYFLILSFYQAA